MEIVETLLKYDTVAETEGSVSAVIVAAGSSTRMGGTQKQLLTLGGIPVLARTLLAFERSRYVKNIVVVARESDILSYQMLADKYMISKLTDIVSGGNCREESVKKGIARLSADTKSVLIHDGARPLVGDSVISRVCESLETFSAVTCAVPVKDTLKLVKDGKVIKTLDRNSCYSVQTPQGFSYSLFKECIDSAGDLSLFTDDCAVVESTGVEVHIVDGDYNNIKITTAEDIAVAEGIIGSLGE